ncbi:MAG: amino acid permease, partial [Bacillota bacterium]|nr:amino acid permease [Bacillota bacterium]
VFMENFWGADDSLPVSQQVMATTKATIWSFIGIEGSVVLSKRAKKSSDVNKSTFIGFACILFIYVASAMLSLGVVPHDQLASMDNPQMAGVLSVAIGPVGEIIVRVGIILSIIGASLGWAILSIECPAAAADDGVFPRIFGKMNAKGTPFFTLLLTTCIQTFFVILGYFSESAYLLMYNLCVSMIMIPYLLSAAFYLKAGLQKRYFPEGAKYGHAVVFGILGTIYGIWMIYSGGINYMLVTTIMYTPGLYIFYRARKERGARTFEYKYEKAIAAIVAILGVISLVLLITGKIVL